PSEPQPSTEPRARRSRPGDVSGPPPCAPTGYSVRSLNQSAQVLMRVDIGILSRQRPESRIHAKRPARNNEVDRRSRRSNRHARRELREPQSLSGGGVLARLRDVKRAEAGLL